MEPSLSVMDSYNWARQQISSIFSGTEQEALIKQVEELKAQIQKAQEHISSQEQKATELSISLKSEMSENECLWDQVEYLTNKLHRERTRRQQESDLFKKERARCFEEKTLRRQLGQQLEEAKKQLVDQKSQEELFAKSNSHTKKASVYQEQIQRLRAEQDALRQQLEQKIKLLQQDASEREKSFCRELKDLKIQISTNLKEEVSQAQAAQLVEDLKDEVCEQEEEEESIPSLQAPELLEEAKDSEEKALEKKRKPSFWKRSHQFLGLRRKKEKREKESISN
ncbi:interaptin-like [Thunnus albacares]|uniref:interaptin-like n=1 Tax=Thunnus albacares TaxID=8236 RepID=UPI001CF68FFF|nr:interaptin-like [Thunnus albacares]